MIIQRFTITAPTGKTYDNGTAFMNEYGAKFDHAAYKALIARLLQEGKLIFQKWEFQGGNSYNGMYLWKDVDAFHEYHYDAVNVSKSYWSAILASGYKYSTTVETVA